MVLENGRESARSLIGIKGCSAQGFEQADQEFGDIFIQFCAG